MIGDNIKRIRELKELGVNELARIADINASYISALERNEKNNPSIKILNKIASALGVSMDAFFKDKLVSDDDAKKFYSFIKNFVLNAPEDIELDIDFLKTIYNDFKLNEPAEEARQYGYRDQVEFTTPEETITFILKQPVLAAYGGYDINEMSSKEIIEFANELLDYLKLLGYKYKKEK